jgi:DNA adenine methylase
MRTATEPVRNSESVRPLAQQVNMFPSTRFMGSKERLLGDLWEQIGRFQPASVLDLCSGSGVVGYMLKAQGCQVYSNDYMAMASTVAKALIANNDTILGIDEVEAILSATDEGDAFVQRTYGGLYYDREDTAFIDRARTQIGKMSGTKKELAKAALIRACIKKRPRGIFTYTGLRYDDGRRDLKLTLEDQFRAAAEAINAAVFSNGRKHLVSRSDIATDPPKVDADLIYLDPPYFSPLSDNEYVRRYHFVEALACDWDGVEIQTETKTKKIRNYPTPFRTEAGTSAAFEELAEFYREKPLIISYSSNALPKAEETLKLLRRHRAHAEVVEVDHVYSFGNQGHLKNGAKNRVKELIFVAY